jgi:riboflavin transporter FmnP
MRIERYEKRRAVIKEHGTLKMVFPMFVAGLGLLIVMVVMPYAYLFPLFPTDTLAQ